MATVSSTSLSSPGIGSGLDVTGIVSKLMQVEQQPLNALNTQEASYQAQLSAYGQLKSAFSAVQTAAQALEDASKFSGTTANLADTSSLTATSSTTAATGTYSLQVTQLAQAQRIASNATTAPTVAAGTLTFTFGTYSTANNVTSFAAGSDAAKTVTLTSGSTLADLRDAINKAGVGVTASVINNGTAQQLVLTGNSTGAAQGFQISGTNGLAGFSYDASTGASSTFNGITASQDAKVTVNGISVARASNTITDAIDGVTLNLKAPATAATSLTIGRDTATPTTLINTLVSSYNSAISTLKNLTSYNASTQTASTLTGDSTARMLQSQVNNILQKSVSGLSGGISYLNDIGVSFQKDGTLAIDSTKLQTALADTTKNVAGLFGTTTASGVTTKGIASQLDDALSQIVGAGGLVANRTDGINASITTIGKRRDELNVRLAQIQANYLAQFTALDTSIASMQQTSTYLTQQLASLASLTKSSN